MFPMTPIAAALALLFCASAIAAPVSSAGTTPRSLLAQAKGLPADFEEHFFDVPLAVRVELDQQPLGEAMVVLSRDDHITLLEFTDTSDNRFGPVEREKWASYLKPGVPLGNCTGACPDQVLAVHYNLENSLVSILTENAERDVEAKRYFDQPAGGSSGLMVRNQLNLNGGQDQDLGGRYGLEASASLGNWSQTFNMQLARLGGPDDKLYHAVHELYTQRELQGSFLRLGYFTPNSEGLTRQPRTFGTSPDTAVGVMYGSSDSLAINSPMPSVYPIYVTANRQGSVEIYREGLLINTQSVPAGLQTLDTRPLPGGIYEVEVRLIEDGQITSTTQELVYKPNNWRNLDERWRYNLFAGEESKLLSNWDQQSSGSPTAGAAVNYLMHPRVILGLSARQIREKLQYGSSIDWTLANHISLFANVYQTQDHGTGLDLQSLYNYGSGSLVVSHNRSWLDTTDLYETLPDGTRIRQRNVFVGKTSNSSLALNHRLSSKSSINARVSHSEGNVEGVGLDLGWNQRTTLFGSDGNWRLSVFDRPGSYSSGSARNRGVDLSVNLAVGAPGQQITGSIGSRTARDGSRDNNGSIGWRKDLKDHVLQNVSVTALTDNHVPAATIEPARTRYHLNKGGVEYRKVRVMKTLTVLGRLVDAKGQPLKGHHVINHASRGVTEVDGFFSMEMNAGSPTLEVRQGNQLLCQFRLDASRHRSENNVLMIGDLRCTPDTLADVMNIERTAG